VSDIAEVQARNAVADAAIARVLAAESDARKSVTAAEADVARIAEAARAAARAIGERAERRARRVVACFERDTAAELARIDAEAAALDQRQPDVAGDAIAVRAAVATLARRIIGASS
jgi:hypothetical protein